MIPEKENALFTCVSMEIYVNLKIFVLLSVLYNSSFCCPDGGLTLLGSIIIKAIEVLTKCVKSIVAPSNTIWIQRLNYFEDIVLT